MMVRYGVERTSDRHGPKYRLTLGGQTLSYADREDLVQLGDVIEAVLDSTLDERITMDDLVIVHDLRIDGERIGRIVFLTGCGHQVHDGYEGHWCAYIVCPECWGMGWQEASDRLDCSGIDVHGGVTYSHLVDGQWMIGWDYAHAGDEVYVMGDVLEDFGKVHSALTKLRDEAAMRAIRGATVPPTGIEILGHDEDEEEEE